MLTIEPPFYQVRGLIAFRDDANPDQFYALPSAVALARRPDKSLCFTLYKYRRDLTDNPALDPTKARGAGLALFETELPIDKAEALRTDVSSLSKRPNARVDPVFFRSGSVHALAAHSAGDKLIEDLVETSKAPIAYPYHSAFALALTAEGATLFEKAAKGGQIPVGVVYEMRFLALTPSLHAKVRMDYDRIYDHFSASIGFTVYYVSARLDLDLSWLVEHDFVHIEITAFTDTADRDRQQDMVMSLVKLRIQNDFFRSGIPADPPDGAVAGPLGQMLTNLVGSKVTSNSALFVLKAKLEVVKEKKAFELIFDGKTAVEMTHVATGFLSTLIAGSPPVTIKEIDMDDPFFSELRVQILSTIDFHELADLREASIQITRGAQVNAYVFDARNTGPYLFEAPITRQSGDEYQYAVEYHFDPTVGAGPTTIKAGPFTSRSRVLTVDPLEHFRYRRIDVSLGPVDAALVPKMHVFLRVQEDTPGAQAQKYAVDLTADKPTQTWRQRFPPGNETINVFATTAWEDPRGQSHPVDDPILITGDTFVALGPYKDLLTITIVPAPDWTAVTQVRAEIRYHDGSYVAQRAMLFDAANKASQNVQIPLLDKTARAYQWRQVVVRQNGTTGETDWADSDKGVLVVGVERKSTADVRIVWVGAPGSALGLRIDFWVASKSGDDQTVSTFLVAGQDSEKTIAVPLNPDGRLHYRYEARRFTEDAEVLVKSAEDEKALLVLR